MKLADVTFEKGLLRSRSFSTFNSSSALVPVEFEQYLSQIVGKFTVADEYNNLFFLMSIQKGQQVHKPVLGRYFYEELLSLLWNAIYDIFLSGGRGLLCVKPYLDIALHQPRAQSLNFWVHGSRYKVDLDFFAPELLIF